MANIKSAKKRINVIEAKTAQNKRIKNRIKDLLKDYELLLEEKKEDEAKKKLLLLEKKLSQSSAKGVYHKNTASRKISAITNKFNVTFKKSA